jgi:hypothetical protein
MPGKKGGCYAGEYQAGENRDGQDILLDLLSPLRLCGTKHDALDLIVYAPALLECIRRRIASKVVEVGLEEPEGLQYTMSNFRLKSNVSCSPGELHSRILRTGQL